MYACVTDSWVLNFVTCYVTYTTRTVMQSKSILFYNKYIFEVWSCIFYTETLLYIQREVMTSLIMYERGNFRSYIVCNINQCHLLGEHYLKSFIMYNTVWHQLWCTRWHLFHMIQEICHKIRQMRVGINQHWISLLLSGSIKQWCECKIWFDSLSLELPHPSCI